MASTDTSTFIRTIRSGSPAATSFDHSIDWETVVDDLANGPYAGDLVQAICSLSTPNDPLCEVAKRVIGATTDAAAMQEIVGVLCSGLDLSRPMSMAFFSGLRESAIKVERHYGVRAKVERHYGVRAAALKGMLYLSQSHRGFFRQVQADLLMIPLDDDPYFLRHVAAITGLVASQDPDTALVALLENLFRTPEASDEAAFGLGAIRLADALGRRNRHEALTQFQAAQDWFLKSTSSSEDRADARLFSSAVGVLLEFGSGRPPSEIVASVERVLSAISEYLAAHLNRDRRPTDLSWVGLRTLEMSHWASLAIALSKLAGSLERAAWIDGARVIEEELCFVLSANRALFARDKDGGIGTIAAPRIETSFLQEKAQLAILDQWLALKVETPWRTEAISLRASVQRRLEDAVARNPIDAAHGTPPFVALEKSGVIPQQEKDEIGQLIAQSRSYFTLDIADPIAEEILRSLIEKLNENEDFQNHKIASYLFVEILLATLRFVVSRDNCQSSEHTAYLFEFEEEAPKEAAIHSDYMNSLRMSPLSRLCTREPQGVGGGRADVQFQHFGFTLVTECKRTFNRLAKGDALRSFGGQVLAYQVSSVRFSALLVLELSDRGGFSENIRERVTVETARLEGEIYHIAIFRLQGRRKRPSQLKLPSS